MVRWYLMKNLCYFLSFYCSTRRLLLLRLLLAVIVYLMGKEWNYNFETIITERVHVNATSPTGLDVEFDISLPLVPCSLLNIDANDPSGQTMSLHLDRRHHIWKHRIKVDEKTGETEFIGDKRRLEQGSTLLHEDHLNELLDELEENLPYEDDEAKADSDTNEDTAICGSCFGAGDEGECCDTCDDVKRAYKRKGWHVSNPKEIDQCAKELGINSSGETSGTAKANEDGEGCNVHGLIALDSGGGSFHLAPGRDQSLTDVSDMNSIFELLMRYANKYTNKQHERDNARKRGNKYYNTLLAEFSPCGLLSFSISFLLVPVLSVPLSNSM